MICRFLYNWVVELAEHPLGSSAGEELDREYLDREYLVRDDCASVEGPLPSRAEGEELDREDDLAGVEGPDTGTMTQWKPCYSPRGGRGGMRIVQGERWNSERGSFHRGGWGGWGGLRRALQEFSLGSRRREECFLLIKEGGDSLSMTGAGCRMESQSALYVHRTNVLSPLDVTATQGSNSDCPTNPTPG